jgi:hypothetical protein
METVGSFAMIVKFRQATRHHIPEDSLFTTRAMKTLNFPPKVAYTTSKTHNSKKKNALRFEYITPNKYRNKNELQINK